MLETQNQNDSRFDRHHLFFQRDSYKTEFQQRFRNHKGLVIPVLRSAHDDLHDLLAPPPKPTFEMMRDCKEILDQDLTILETDPFYALKAIVNYLDLYKELTDDSKLATKARTIQSNLGLQALVLSNRTQVEVQQQEQGERLDHSIAISHELPTQSSDGGSRGVQELYSDHRVFIRSID